MYACMYVWLIVYVVFSSKKHAENDVPTLTRAKEIWKPVHTRVPPTTTTTTTSSSSSSSGNNGTRMNESPIGGVTLPLPVEQNVHVKKVGGKYRLTDSTKPSSSTTSATTSGTIEVPDEHGFPKRRPISYLAVDSDSDSSLKDKKVRKGCMYVCTV